MNVDTGRYPCVESDLGVARYASAKCAPLESVNGFFEGFGDRAPGDTRVLIVGSHCFCGKEIVTTRRVLLYSDVTLPLQRYSVHTHTHTRTRTHEGSLSLYASPLWGALGHRRFIAPSCPKTHSLS